MPGTDGRHERNRQVTTSKKGIPHVFEIDGTAYKLVGIITQAEYDTETAGKSLVRTVTGLIIVNDVPPDKENIAHCQ